VAAVGFEIELTLEGVVDRFDDLPQRFEAPGTGSFGFAFAGRAQQVQSGLGECGFEVAASTPISQLIVFTSLRSRLF
jgi:hypothetical protein